MIKKIVILNLLLVHFTTSFSAPFNPLIRNPQNADTNSSCDNNNPRNPCPFWDHIISNPTDKENPHLQHKQRSKNRPENSVESIETRRQELKESRSHRQVGLPIGSQGPHVLARTCDLGKNKKYEESKGAMSDHETTCYKDIERSQVVAYEENVVWEEDHVVK